MKRFVFNKGTGNTLPFNENWRWDFTVGNLVNIEANNIEEAISIASSIKCCKNCACEEVCAMNFIEQNWKEECIDYLPK